jgi:hypothetical protein
VICELWVLVESARGVGWEAAVKASLLMALVLIVAHLSSHKQLSLAHKEPRSLLAGNVPVEIGADRTDTWAKSQLAANCSIVLRDQSLNQNCPVTALLSEDHVAMESRTGAGVSVLIDNLEGQVAPSRPTRINSVTSVAAKFLYH